MAADWWECGSEADYKLCDTYLPASEQHAGDRRACMAWVGKVGGELDRIGLGDWSVTVREDG